MTDDGGNGHSNQIKTPEQVRFEMQIETCVKHLRQICTDFVLVYQNKNIGAIGRAGDGKFQQATVGYNLLANEDFRQTIVGAFMQALKQQARKGGEE